MSTKLFFICGLHCSGKTSILSELERQGIIDLRGSEIGKDLFYERKLQTATQGPAFEMEIAVKELERDISYMQSNQVIGVETWHAGNLSYALVRNPQAIDNLVEIANKSPFIQQAQGIWLRMPPHVIKERTQTFKEDSEWATEFYTEIDEQLEHSLKVLNLFHKTTKIDASGSFEETLELVKEAILAVLDKEDALT